MPSPTFDGQKIFDSLDVDGNPFTEGVLYLEDYDQIIQSVHFNGANGDATVTHGWGNREWCFKGYLTVTDEDITVLGNLIAVIQNYIDEADYADATYHPLVDSFGLTYDKAQIRHYKPLDIRKAEPGWLAQVEIRGIVKGMQLDGTAGSGE